MRVYRAPTDAGTVPALASHRAAAPPRVAAAHPVVRGPAEPPSVLILPSLDVQAPVRPVSVDRSGRLGVPDDPRTLGWWSGGEAPGAAQGAVVLDGHVDSATRGLGALLELSRIRPGAPVLVRTARGREYRYRVAARRVEPRGSLPVGAFAPSGPPRLVLITCGGPFDRRARRYQDDIVVYAVPR